MSGSDPSSAAALKTASKAANKQFTHKHAGSAKMSCPNSDPCTGIGMQAPRAADEYVKEFKEFQEEWPDLTQKERRKRLAEIANKQLTKSGAPPVTVVGRKTGGPGEAWFDDDNWALVVDKQTIKSDTLSDDDAKEFADTVYHEARHAEQSYMEARLRALEGQSASTIRDEMGVPGKVAKAAKKQPAVRNSLVACCGEVMRDSMHTKAGNRKRNRVYDNMDKREAEMNKAEKQLQKMERRRADGKATADQVAAAQRKFDLAEERFDRAHEAYTKLPEEADAWKAGDMVQDRW